MGRFGRFILLVVVPFLVGFYGVRYYNTTQEPQVPQDSKVPHVLQDPKGVPHDSQIETGRIKCIDHKVVYCSEYVILKVVKD